MLASVAVGGEERAFTIVSRATTGCFIDHQRPMDHSLRNTALEINRVVTGGPCSQLCFMAHAAADCHTSS